MEVGFAQLRLALVVATAGARKATIYRCWRSKEEIAIELHEALATPMHRSATSRECVPS